MGERLDFLQKAFAKRVQKKYRNLEFKESNEVLLLNVQKRCRKGGRIEAEYAALSGKTCRVTA